MKVPKTAKRALAIGILMTTIIRLVKDPSIALGRLAKQCSIAYGGFVHKTDRATAKAVGDEVKYIWTDILNGHKTIYTNKEIGIIVYYVSRIISSKDFRGFFLVQPFKPDEFYKDDIMLHNKAQLIASDIDKACNELFGTHTVVPLVKKEKKEKKPRESKAQVQARRELKRLEREQKASRKKALRRLIKKKKVTVKLININYGEIEVVYHLDDTIEMTETSLPYGEKIEDVVAVYSFKTVEGCIEKLSDIDGITNIKLEEK